MDDYMVVLPAAHPLCVKEKIEIENLEKEGEQITLEVSDRIYSELQEGDCGSLSCRDGKLVSFGALQNRDDRERSFRG